jgi:rRNA-processing protein FCF1
VYPDTLFQKYKSKGILIDTNLLLLVAIGAYDAQRILTFKRTQEYTLEDYALMLRILEFFERRITTPNILTEVDNLARQLPEKEHNAISQVLSDIVQYSFEIHVPSTTATQTLEYALVGLADVITISVSTEVLVLTDDFPLSNRLASAGRDVLNINHIRNLI